MAALAVGLVYQVSHLVKVSQESSRTDLVIAQMDVVRALLVDKEAALRGYGPSAIHRRSWIFMEGLCWPGVPPPPGRLFA